MTVEQKGPTLGVCFGEVTALYRVKENDCRTKGTISRCLFWGGDGLIESQRK